LPDIAFITGASANDAPVHVSNHLHLRHILPSARGNCAIMGLDAAPRLRV